MLKFIGTFCNKDRHILQQGQDKGLDVKILLYANNGVSGQSHFFKKERKRKNLASISQLLLRTSIKISQEKRNQSQIISSILPFIYLYIFLKEVDIFNISSQNLPHTNPLV